MTRKMAEALATVLGGRAVPTMPQSRAWGVEWTRPDGRFVAIETCGAYLFQSAESYASFHAGEDYEVSPVIDGAEWDEWGSAQWAEALAFILGGHEVMAGGHIWLVGIEMPDGRYVAIGDESIGVYPSREHFESGNADGSQHYEFV